MIFKTEALDEINAALTATQKRTKSLFDSANEEEILAELRNAETAYEALILEVEKKRRVYLWLKQKSVETAKARKMRKLKQESEKYHEDKKLLEKTPPISQGNNRRKAQTKEEKMDDALKRLGIDPKAMKAAIKGTSK